jgi:putative endonuclease
MMANERNTVIYTGITNDLKKRVYEHKEKLIIGFTSKYNINKLVYFEIFDNPELAISREKQIKAGSRANKIKLIEGMNNQWKDLFNDI